MAEELEIESLGVQGDGVARTSTGQVYVPFTLPGERVRVKLSDGRGELLEIIRPSAERRAPLCRHFGSCGGCALQHMAEPAYQGWKREQVAAAFRSRGIEVEVAPLLPCPPASRRRATFAARRTRSEVLFGYRKRHSHDIIPIEECPVLRPAIVVALDGLRKLVSPLLSRRGETRIAVLEVDTGLDVSIEGARPGAADQTLGELALAAHTINLARLTVNGEIAIQARTPVLSVSGYEVAPPPGAFLQASKFAEEALVERVRTGVGEAEWVADLFCGLGTFTLPLAEKAEVLASESETPSLRALEQAVKRAKGLRKVGTSRRDLHADPLGAKELKGFDAVVFDPPREGASRQAEKLAESAVPRIVAVSCNPATLARDARTLVDGGYRLLSVEPVDQFLFSPHVEVVAVFAR